MRRLFALTAAAVAAVTLTAAPTVVASTAGAKYEIHRYAWKTMSLAQRIAAQRRLVASDRIVLATWSSKRWHEQVSHDVNGDAYTTGWIRPLDLDAPPPAWVVFRRAHLRWTTRELDESRRALARRVGSVAPSGFPPHHALWACIGRFEGSPTSVNPNGHYGMLQMTYDWMNLIHGRASDYPQATQEWAAERAWAANHYSYSFLYGQWFAYDNADGCYHA